ncbi:hypothetical protein SCLCIDRAFT_765139 [Scleroderma citrinum Foug A]|uniref:Uncharacterized protein n=1 Tax=Scleroderma citrinum Foug A TaxID=1036808 RepID=A0A0C3D2X3_9AGAM|nr:hypothetical protein SCLCIDRAFT_765139 [Scleroderma citrinum Foug A]
MACMHVRTINSTSVSSETLMFILSFFIFGALIFHRIRRRPLANSPDRFVRFRPHVDDPVVSTTPMVVLRSIERGARQHVVTGHRHQTMVSPTPQAISAPLR